METILDISFTILPVLSSPRIPATCCCASSQKGSADTKALIPLSVMETTLSLWSFPASILTSPLFSRSFRFLVTVVRSMMAQSANFVTVIFPNPLITINNPNCVPLNPEGRRNSSYVCVIKRLAFRRFEHTHALPISAHFRLVRVSIFLCMKSYLFHLDCIRRELSFVS